MGVRPKSEAWNSIGSQAQPYTPSQKEAVYNRSGVPVSDYTHRVKVEFSIHNHTGASGMWNT